MTITKTKNKQVVGGKTFILTTTKTVKVVGDYISEAADNAEKKASEVLSAAMNNPEVKKVVGGVAQSMKVIMDIMRTYRKVEETMEMISFIIKDISLLAGAWTNPTTIPVALNDFAKIAQAYTSRMPMQLLKATLDFVLKMPVSTTTSVEAKEIVDALNKTTNDQKTLAEKSVVDNIKNIEISKTTNDISTTGTLEPENIASSIIKRWEIVEEADKRLKLLKVRKYLFSIYGTGGELDDTHLGEGITDGNKIFLPAVPTKSSLPVGASNNYCFVLDELRYYRYYNNEYYINPISDVKKIQLKNELKQKIREGVKKNILLLRPDFQSTMDKLGLESIDIETYNQLIQLDKDSIKNVEDYIDNYVEYLIENIISDEEIGDLINKAIKIFEKNLPNGVGSLRGSVDSALSNALREAMNAFDDVSADYYIEAVRLLTENINSILDTINSDFGEIVVSSETFSSTNITDATTTAKSKYVTYVDFLKTEFSNNFATIASTYSNFGTTEAKTLDLLYDLILVEKANLRRLSSTNFYLNDAEFDSLKASFDSIFNVNKLELRNNISNIIKRVGVEINSLDYNTQIYEEKKLSIAFNSVFDDFKNNIINSLNNLLDTDIFFESYTKRYRIFTRVIYFINYIVQMKLNNSYNSLESSLETFYTEAAGNSNTYKTSVLEHLENVWKNISFHKTMEYTKFEFDEQTKNIILGLTDYYSKTAS